MSSSSTTAPMGEPATDPAGNPASDTVGQSAGQSTGQPATRPRLFALSWLLVGLVVPSWILLVLLVVSVATAVVWVGLALWLVAAAATGAVTGVYRRVAGRILGERVDAAYRATQSGGLFSRLQTTLTDPARWRDVAYVFFAISLGFAMTLCAAVTFLIFPVGFWLSPILLRAWAGATKTIVGPTGQRALEQRIGHLEQSRSESIDHSAAELRRIERDLHDGAQAQLVALGLNLGLAEELVTQDPATAATMIADARTASRTALAELRSLVRGIHPPVLADRGLTGAIEALALAHPRPVEVDCDVEGRFPEPIESAMYFAVAEALTNAAKHAAAHHTWIRLGDFQGVLTGRVGDDGVGGARVTPGGGLAGIDQRIAAFDGTVTVSSPLGGPTVVTIAMPCPPGDAPGRHG